MLEAQEQKMGFKPHALETKPKLLTRLAWYYECFTELTHDRSYTQGQPLRLSTSQIYVYWKAFGLVDFEDFYIRIRQIDRIWMDAVTKKTKTDQERAEKSKPKPPAPGRRR